VHARLLRELPVAAQGSASRDRDHGAMDHDHDAQLEDHDRGLAFDMPKLMSRRRALGVLTGSVTMAALAACGSSSKDGADTTVAASGSKGSSATAEIPDETAGPYPGDGSNGPNVLTESGIVRSDITTSFGDASGVAAGVPTAVEMTLLDVAAGGTPLAGAAVYLWQCNIDGHYSMYDEDVADENYLRGVQQSGSDGKVRFTTIFPAAYAGRWPHIHFEVYESLEAATAAGAKLKTSQIALPKDACDLVYAAEGYKQSVTNLAQTSLDTDNVFSDGYASQLATTSGTVDSEIHVKLNVGV
jgi:protocatechuate 3,4-dioxygenase beta subunit